MARYSKKQYEPKTAKAAIKQLRLAYGLPIKVDINYKNAPWGYDKSPEDPYLLVPNTRMLRALFICYKGFNEGYTASVLCEWFEKNTGKKLDNTLFSKLYHRRPVFKEIERPLHEREQLYRTALQEAEDQSKEAYEAYTQQRNLGRPKSRKTLEEFELQVGQSGGEGKEVAGEAGS